MLIRQRGFSDAELDRFRSFQRTSFSILEETAAGLIEGQTELEVARALVRRYREAGVGAFFHLPVVLFGERTALPGKWTLRKFYPCPRALAPGDAVVLDASPLFGGYLVDTSYSFCFGENPEHRQMMSDLSRFRVSVRDAVNEGRHFRAIAEDVATEIEALGYEPVHRKHPGAVLGHRAIKTADRPTVSGSSNPTRAEGMWAPSGRRSS
jgi:Xaa-Pro aminopeptidase